MTMHPRFAALFGTAFVTLSLTACTAPNEEGTVPSSTPASSSAASGADASNAASTDTAAPSAAAAAGEIKPGSTLRVISHDSFKLSDGMLERFEQQTGVKVERVEAGDAGEMLSRLILTKKAPIADVVFGLDNSMLPRAQREDLLVSYRSPAEAQVPPKYQLGDLLNTVDYGVVALNYDRAAWKKTGLALPTDLAQLAKPEYAGKVVVPSPSTSSPGLAFLLATVNELGEEGAWAWWKEAKANGLKIVSGWNDAYYTEFTRAGGNYPIVLSYATSPAAEVFYAEGYDPAKRPAESPTANLLLPGLLHRHDLRGRDAAFATELVGGTLRWLGSYDAVLDQLAARPPDPAVRDALRLGTHQLLGMRVPDHAAVASTVELVRARIGHRPAGFVNALLRRVARHDLAEWMELLDAQVHWRGIALHARLRC